MDHPCSRPSGDADRARGEAARPRERGELMAPREAAAGSELGESRERLARLETTAVGDDRASAERHALLPAAVAEIKARLDRAEGRTWRVLLSVALLAAGTGAGGA